MRDWLFMLAPIGIVVYFLVYPGQFHAFIVWATGFIR